MILTPRNFRQNKIEHIKRVLLGKSIITRGTKISTSSLNSFKVAIPPTSSLVVTSKNLSSASASTVSTPLNNMRFFGKTFSKITQSLDRESQNFILQKAHLQTETFVNEAKENTYAKIRQISLIAESLQNPRKLPPSNSFSLKPISETGISLANKSYQEMIQDNFSINMRVQPYNSLETFSKTTVFLYGSVKENVCKVDHGFLGHILENFGDGSYLFEGLCLTSSPVNKVDLKDGSVVFKPNISIGNTQIFGSESGKNIQNGFFGIFTLNFGAQPIALRLLHQTTLEKAMALLIENCWERNYISCFVNSENIENLVFKQKTNLYLEKNNTGNQNGDI